MLIKEKKYINSNKNYKLTAFKNYILYTWSFKFEMLLYMDYITSYFCFWRKGDDLSSHEINRYLAGFYLSLYASRVYCERGLSKENNS